MSLTRVEGGNVPRVVRSSRRGALLDGAARALDMGGTRRKRVVVQSTEDALASDWHAVGDDLRSALRRFKARAT